MALSVAVAVGDAAADQLISKMAEAMKSLKIGPCHDADNDFGPVITKQHQQKVFGYIDSAEEQGATIVVDGRNPSVAYENGFYVGGTLIDRVTADMDSYDAEIFGPVLQRCVLKPMKRRSALPWITNMAMAPLSLPVMGIQRVILPIASMWLALTYPFRCLWPITALVDGSARPLAIPTTLYGPDGVRFYTKRKTITQRWPSAGVREGAQFSMPTMS